MKDNVLIKNLQQTGVTKPIPYALKIGFFAGVFWGIFRLIAYYCNFTGEPAAFLIKMWIVPDQLNTMFAHIVGTISFIIFSMAASFIYMWLFRTLEGPWPGLWYGLGWWGILFGLGPILGFTRLSTNVTFTIAATDFCLFIVWGMFIGYSIAFEFTDEASREPSTSS